MAFRRFKRDSQGRFAHTNSSGAKKSVAKKKKNNSFSNARKLAKVQKNKQRDKQHQKLVDRELYVKNSDGSRRRRTPEELKKRSRNIKIAVRTIQVARVAAFAYGGAYNYKSANNTSSAARTAHARMTGQRISNANTRGLGSLIKAKQSRGGVYKITNLR